MTAHDWSNAAILFSLTIGVLLVAAFLVAPNGGSR